MVFSLHNRLYQNYCSERPVKGSIHAASEECTTATGASEGLEKAGPAPQETVTLTLYQLLLTGSSETIRIYMGGWFKVLILCTVSYFRRQIGKSPVQTPPHLAGRVENLTGKKLLWHDGAGTRNYMTGKSAGRQPPTAMWELGNMFFPNFHYKLNCKHNWHPPYKKHSRSRSITRLNTARCGVGMETGSINP